MMKYTAIYNMNSKFFRYPDEKIPTIDEIIESDDYCILGDVEAIDLEDAYYILNMNHPEHIVEKVRELAASDRNHTKYPTIHTSLSVCDILVEDNPKGLKYYFCDNYGWEEIEA